MKSEEIKPAQAAGLLGQEFGIQTSGEEISEEELVGLMAQRVAEMLEKEPEQLMSMLYRLDVEERKIKPVMQPGALEPANIGLARLILERQKQRMETKRSVKTAPLEGLEGWEW